MPPLIALTTYPADDGRVNLPREYIDCIRNAGGRTVLVPPGEPDPSGLLDIVDGLVLTGGGDIAPKRWNGQTHDAVYMTDEARDSLEIVLAQLAVERRMPVMCICRGIQVLNVALGGTLHVHVPDVFGDKIAHRLPPREPVAHEITVEPDSKLARVMGATRVEPMSWHHQAIDTLGAGLRAVAWAPDGVIEAVELDAYSNLIAVQWHPELTATTDPTQMALFGSFVGAAASSFVQ